MQLAILVHYKIAILVGFKIAIKPDQIYNASCQTFLVRNLFIRCPIRLVALCNWDGSKMHR